MKPGDRIKMTPEQRAEMQRRCDASRAWKKEVAEKRARELAETPIYASAEYDAVVAERDQAKRLLELLMAATDDPDDATLIVQNCMLTADNARLTQELEAAQDENTRLRAALHRWLISRPNLRSIDSPQTPHFRPVH